MTRYEKCKLIVENKQWEEMEGVIVDLSSAHVYATVYELVNEQNKAKLESLTAASAIMLCWKLIS